MLLGDHPRVCGKDVRFNVRLVSILGSPPRMRERLASVRANVTENGITPAYAGKTRIRHLSSLRLADHPRVCGKDRKISKSKRPPQGSPPRMRERLFCNSVLNFSEGITPAYAGKTVQDSAYWQVAGRITPAYAGKTLKIPIKMAISITETVKFHLLFKFNLSQNMVQQYFIFMK